MARPDLDRLLTLYGRKPVLEALQDASLPVFRLHLADSNRPAAILDEIAALAHRRGVPVAVHGKLALSRISKNSQQDQGVALDIAMPNFTTLDDFVRSQGNAPFRLIALDSVTNPQNLGMIVRSVCASPATGLLLPSQGCARLDALVVKASAGTLFRCRIVRCAALTDALAALAGLGATLCVLDGHATQSLYGEKIPGSAVFVLGNETRGVTTAVAALPHRRLAIPMHNGVESLNVAVAAALVAFAAGAH